MSMTQEEVTKRLKALKARCERLIVSSSAGNPEEWRKDAEAIDMAITALRPVSWEQVEKVFPGCEKCRNQANWPSWIEKGFVYCPKCGTPLTSWAWEKQMKRLEALKDGKDRSI